MPGFVDVSNWSDQDIKRLGHVDEYDNPPTWNRNRGRSTGTRVAVKSTTYSVSDVWAAACAANRINGGYFKEYAYQWDEMEQVNKIVKRKNRDIMMEFLANPGTITQQDRDEADRVRDFIRNDLTFRALKGQLTD